jgi:glycosyltransferase involved in cell wall biosynthesis
MIESLDSARSLRSCLVIVFDRQAGAALAQLRGTGRLVEIDHVAEEDLPALYSMADLFVQPSIIEGFGLPVLEAMACGCPVACANTSSLPEVAGDAAVQFDPFATAALADTLQAMLAQPARRHELRARAAAGWAVFVGGGGRSNARGICACGRRRVCCGGEPCLIQSPFNAAQMQSIFASRSSSHRGAAISMICGPR